MKQIFCTVWTKEGRQELTEKQYLDLDSGKPHRLDGPAVEEPDGSKEWFVDGKEHRLDGPSFECPDGTKCWCVDGKRHRLDGPAYEWPDGSKEWWIDDKELDTDEVETWLEDNKVNLSEPEGQMAFKLRWM